MPFVYGSNEEEVFGVCRTIDNAALVLHTREEAGHSTDDGTKDDGTKVHGSAHQC